MFKNVRLRIQIEGKIAFYQLILLFFEIIVGYFGFIMSHISVFVLLVLCFVCLFFLIKMRLFLAHFDDDFLGPLLPFPRF